MLFFYFFLLKPSLMMSVRPDLVTAWPASTRCSNTRSPATVSASSLGPGLVHVDMSSDIVREESFRTALRNQKRRLSATEKKPVEAGLGGFQSGVNKSVLNNLKTRDSLTPPRRDFLTPPRNSFTPPRWEIFVLSFSVRAMRTFKPSFDDVLFIQLFWLPKIITEPCVEN